MARYMVERTFPEGLSIPMTAEGATACMGVFIDDDDLRIRIGGADSRR